MNSKTARINMVGMMFGKLHIVSEVKKRNKNGHITYNCLCLCGNKKEILGASIRSGATTSCGCSQKESATTHGMDGTPTYRVWISMKGRCSNESHKQYSEWGGRGISICKRWQSFDNFFFDMGVKPKGLSIDRVDNNKGYDKSNCRWATPKQQAQNRRVTILVFHKGKSMFIDEFSKCIGLSESGARKRVYRLYSKNIDGVFVKETD
jgi:hypothetical protein